MATQSPAGGSARPTQGCAPNELTSLFPTALLRRRLPDAERRNARLRQIVLSREKSDPGVRHSNVGGWHSSADLWEWPEPEMQELCNFVKQAATDLTATVAPGSWSVMRGFPACP